MKNIKKEDGKDSFLQYFGSSRVSLEQSTNVLVYVSAIWIYYGFKKLNQLQKAFAPLTSYSSSYYGESVDASYFTNLFFHSSLSLCFPSHICVMLLFKESSNLCQPVLRIL
jgi:hypothetical protein